MSELDVEVRPGEGMATVALQGELDLSTVNRVEQALAEVEASRPSLLVLDLRELSFLDSSGLRLVLEADSRARLEGRTVAVIPGPEPVHRVFLITLLDKRLNFVQDAQLPGGKG